MVFGISLAMIKTDVKNILLESLFFLNLAAIFFVCVCVICLLRSSWLLCLKQKVVHSVPGF